MKMLMICLIFFFSLSACDNGSTMPQSLLAMQIQATGIEKLPYKMKGAYITGNQIINSFDIKNNYLPRKYGSFDVQYLILYFDKEISQIDNIRLNGKSVQSTIAEYNYKQIIINLYYVKDENFIITGEAILIDGNTITIETPTITYK